jgi:hypothetical protein
LSGASSGASLVTPIVERENHGFRFEETLETRLQRFGPSIAKTLQYLFVENRLSINGLTVVHRRQSIQAVQQSQPPNAKDARAALDSGEFDKAATLAVQILDADPQNVNALRVAVMAEGARGRHKSVFQLPL